MSNVITLILIDDHDVVRQGASAFLSSFPEFHVIGEASDGHAALKMIAQRQPDVALVDLAMPGLDGVSTIRRIKRDYPAVKIVVLTSYDSEDYVLSAIKAGAISYILKADRMQTLADAIRQAAEGKSVISPAVAANLVNTVQQMASEVPPEFAELTAREFEVLKLIAVAKSNSEIAEILVVSENTIKSYASNILKKLNLSNRTELAVIAWRNGLIDDSGE